MIFAEDDREAFNRETHCHICEKEITEIKIPCNGIATHLRCGKQDDDLSNVNWKNFNSQDYCSVCEEKFINEKVRDHCHITGKYRGAAHKSCNLSCKVPKFIPVIFHNLSGYDAHLFIRNIGKTKGRLNCIAQNEEKYISFSKKIQVDLYEDKEGKVHPIYIELRFIDSSKFMLKSLDQLASFLPKEQENYGLDPAHYYTSPGLAWDAILKYTEIQLELLTDQNMLLFFEEGIRSGVATISNRYGKANNPYMINYDKKKDKVYLAYLDANNLYGWAMSQPLPVGGFKWMTKAELKNWRDYPCVLEVDLVYPKELHDLHNDYPLAPETLIVNKVAKLIPNLRNKTKYILHYKNLLLYLSLEMKLKKIHRGISFREDRWMKPYIDLNTELKAKSKNAFEMDFFLSY